jgi:hypothetical protein
VTASIVDENVPIVANDVARLSQRKQPLAPQADNKCRLAAIQRLRQIISSGHVLIDDAGSLLAGYRQYLSGKGQPGVGDAFLKYLADNEYNEQKVTRIALSINNDRTFAAFPEVPQLATFDAADRIFVALALTAPIDSTVVNAVDSDYSHHSQALVQFGVRVEELCPETLKAK